MLTILKDLGLVNDFVLQICAVFIPVHQKEGRSHETMTLRADRPLKTCWLLKNLTQLYLEKSDSEYALTHRLMPEELSHTFVLFF